MSRRESRSVTHKLWPAGAATRAWQYRPAPYRLAAAVRTDFPRDIAEYAGVDVAPRRITTHSVFRVTQEGGEADNMTWTT